MTNNKNEKEKFYGIKINDDIPKLDMKVIMKLNL